MPIPDTEKLEQQQMAKGCGLYCVGRPASPQTEQIQSINICQYNAITAKSHLNYQFDHQTER